MITEINGKTIQELAQKHTGIFIRPDLRKVEIYELDRSKNVGARLVEIGKSGYRID